MAARVTITHMGGSPAPLLVAVDGRGTTAFVRLEPGVSVAVDVHPWQSVTISEPMDRSAAVLP